MSFNEMTLIELKKVAEEFGVDSPVKITKQRIIDLLAEEGVTYDVYKHFDKLSKDAEDKKAAQEQQQQNIQVQQFQPPQYFAPKNILVKMDRANFSYQAGRYNFTQEHPYVAMTEAEANYIFATETGFRMATPHEVQQFYS
jgi:hypothetical protein